MVNILEAIILGIIQGITEWLPVSSSGHLVIFQQLFNVEASIFFDVLLHFATLLIIFIVFWKDIKGVLIALKNLDFKCEGGRLAKLIFIGSIPTAVIGFAFRDNFESLFSNINAVGAALIITGLLLFFSRKVKGRKKIGPTQAIRIGFVQGFALIPGISRSGSTISLAMLMGIDRKKAARFSFLLVIPAIIGATIFEAKNAVIDSTEIIPMFVGFITAMIVGYFALIWLLKVIEQGKFYLFSYYCFALGVLLLLL